MKLIKTSFLLLTAIVFISCGENTQTPITKDISSIKIHDSNVSIYSTDAIRALSATVFYDDGSEDNATQNVSWFSSDYSVLGVSVGRIFALSNGGESNVSIKYKDFSDITPVKVHKLTAITFSPANIITTGETGVITVKGSFDNNDSNISILKTVTFKTDVNSTIVTSTADNNLTINIISFPTTITATVFGEDFNHTYFGN